MSSFSVNQVSNDYIQFLFTYNSEEFLSLVEDLLKLMASASVDTSIYENMPYSKFFYDKEVREALSYILLNKVKKINEESFNNSFTLIENVSPIVRIDHPNATDCVITYSTLILDNSLKLRLPKYNEIDHKIIDLEDNDGIINLLMMNHNLVKQVEVEEAYLDSYVYVNIFNKDVLLPNFLDSDSIFELDCDILGKKKGDLVKVKNREMNNRVEYYKISRITNEVALDLNCEYVCMFHYKDIKDVELFKKTVVNDFNKMISFGKTITSIYSYIKKYSDIKVSKFARNHFVSIDTKPILFSDLQDEEYNTIKNIIIDAYLEKKIYNKVNIDTTYLEKYFKNEYELFKLFRTIDNISYEDFLSSRKNNALLYTLVKNGGY